MPRFLTYDPALTTQLLAQGNPMGQGLGQLGQAMSGIAQMKQQKEAFQLEKQFKEIQADAAKLQKLNEVSTLMADTSFEIMDATKGMNPMAAQEYYLAYRKQKIEQDPMFKTLLPDTYNPNAIAATAKKSQAMQFYSTQELNRQKAEAEAKKEADKVKEAAEKPSTIPTPAKKDIATTETLLRDVKYDVEGKMRTLKDMLSGDEYEEAMETIASRAKVGPKGAKYADRIKEEATKFFSEEVEAGDLPGFSPFQEARIKRDTGTPDVATPEEIKQKKEILAGYRNNDKYKDWTDDQIWSAYQKAIQAAK